MVGIGFWERHHLRGASVAVRRRRWGDFTIWLNERALEAPAEGYTSFKVAKEAADQASGCPQPCGCPAWTGPAAVLYEVADTLPLVCQRCHKSLVVVAAGGFVSTSIEVPHDADHANYTLACKGCGAEYQWTYWSMPKQINA